MSGFWTQFEAYVRSYLPDWQFRRGGPEVESALLTVLGEMLEDSRRRLDELPDRHWAEFLSAWDHRPRPSEPMHVYAALTAPHSVLIPQGSSFYRAGDGTKLWHTMQDAWAEPCRLTAQICSDGRNGKLLAPPPPACGAPVRLFDFKAPGMQAREARFRRPGAFTSQSGCELALRLEGETDGLLRFLGGGENAGWYLESGGAEQVLDTPILAGRELRFQLPPCREGASLLVRVHDGRVPPPAPIRCALVESRRACGGPVVVMLESGPCRDAVWRPFGTRLMPWSACYLGSPDALCLPGAAVTVTWRQSFVLSDELLPGGDQEPEYRPIMRRLPKPPPPIRDVRADDVLWEYWNGTVWRMIPETDDCVRLFSDPGTQPPGEKQMQVTFRWPADAARCEVQGVENFWLRWRLRSCEGAGWLPVCYHAPEISQLQISAHLPPVEAELERRCGLCAEFTPLAGYPEQILFPDVTGKQDSWWLGFDQPPGGESTGLYLELRGRIPGGTLSVWEAEPDGGERLLTFSDQTGGLAHSGLLRLSGFLGRKSVRFGRDCWWIRIREESGAFHRPGNTPVLENLSCGAALLCADGDDTCTPGDAFQPLHGGAVRAAALTAGFGGVPAETDRDALCRLRMERHHLGRAVSALDVDQMIRGAVRDVVRTRCVREGDTLQVGVLMRDTAHHSAAFARKRREIRNLLLRQSPIPSLGLSLQIREPCFYPIHVMAWIQPPDGAGFEESGRKLKAALREFLDPAAGNFRGLGWHMGELPAAAQLRTCLQSAVPGLRLFELVASAVAPDGHEWEPGSVQNPFALPVSGVHTILNLKGDI